MRDCVFAFVFWTVLSVSAGAFAQTQEQLIAGAKKFQNGRFAFFSSHSGSPLFARTLLL